MFQFAILLLIVATIVAKVKRYLHNREPNEPATAGYTAEHDQAAQEQINLDDDHVRMPGTGFSNNSHCSGSNMAAYPIGATRIPGSRTFCHTYRRAGSRPRTWAQVFKSEDTPGGYWEEKEKIKWFTEIFYRRNSI